MGLLYPSRSPFDLTPGLSATPTPGMEMGNRWVYYIPVARIEDE